jgi:hypothetical protein
MPGYRICEIRCDGSVARLLIEFTVESDAIAIAYAERLPATKLIEVWEAERLVDSIFGEGRLQYGAA